MSDPIPALFCANHPNIETSLRCNRCEKPICIKCAVLTPTGYRCKECVRGQQKVFETSQNSDYIIAFAVAGLLSFLGSLILPQWLLLTIIGSPIAGTLIAEVVRRAVQRRRSKRLFQVVALSTGLGCVPVTLFHLFTTGVMVSQFGIRGAGSLLSLLSIGIYMVLTISTAYYRLSGQKISFDK